MAYYKDVREYLNALESAGKLVRIRQSVNKDTEMHPLVRLQYRGLPEDQRRAFLFEKITDVRGRSYDIPVAVACYAGSLDIYALGMQCKKDEIYGKWTNAQANPIEPIEVNSAPCQERVISGDELKQTGLDLLPVPISTPGFDNGPYTTSLHWVTRDPETGQYNMGNYRGQIKATDRMGCYAGNFSGLRAHWNKCRALKKPLEVACVIGVPPNLSYAAVARIAPGVSEFGVAGGISGEPVELVRCKTVDLLACRGRLRQGHRRAAHGLDVGKILVVVDEGIDARDADSVNWALTFRMQPHRDARIVDAGMMSLDPSIVPPEDFGEARSAL
ncbi:MAG: UbiD family decarboxylase [Candidatus Binatia bacterium]